MISDGCEGKLAIDEDFASGLEDRNTAMTTSTNGQLGLKIFTNYYGSRLKIMEEQFSMYCYCLVLNQGKG
jgi:hypothetical protein